MLKPNEKYECKTFGTVGGENYDSLVVRYEYQPAEPDVNVQEGLELNSIEADGKDIYDLASEAELDLIAERILENIFQEEDDDRGWEPPEPDEAQEWYDYDPDC